MAVDYDLVIIGDTHAARVAAQQAVLWPARVGLVLTPGPVAPPSHLYVHGLRQAASHGFHRDPHYPWQYAKTLVDRLSRPLAPESLAAQGVDVMVGKGEFNRQPTLSFNCGRRVWRSRRYLLAMGSQPQIPSHIPGLSSTEFITLATLPTIADRAQIPRRWAIVGDEAIGVELAQAFCQLGYEVIVIGSTDRLLLAEDPAASMAVQWQLEAAGVRLMTKAAVQGVGTLEGGQKYVKVEHQKYPVDEIFLATAEQPYVEGFGLGGVRVEYDLEGVRVDEQLLTSNGQIYACGGVCGKVLGGYYGEHLAEYEAGVAVHNALSKKRRSMSYQKSPWVMFTTPQVARIGPTEQDARSQYRGRLAVLYQSARTSPSTVMAEQEGGFVKLLVQRTGPIIGATIVGHQAAEMLQVVALAMRQRLSVEQLGDFPGIALSNTHLLVMAARQWRRPPWWVRAIDPLVQRLVEVIETVGDRIPLWLRRKKS